ncbi:MAG TPA: xanthine dehydrogenase family protein molybdopterin-binding subunit, partial [Casimicrobiaceae bacterium]|nr:xanthine dehydrogenase family protein molybdopterin-binding subunit [Casimicrobiaceae bacterium]
HPGVRAIHVMSSPAGRAVEVGAEARRSASRRVLYVGDPIAAVAATTPRAVDEAIGLFNIDYEPLPFVVDIDDARKVGSPVVFEHDVAGESFAGGAETASAIPMHGNVRGPNRAGSRGEVARGFAEADMVVEGEFRTQVETHCCLEPHAVVADWQPDRLTVYLSTQYAAGVRTELAAAFGLPRSRVRVIVEAMGGGFGSKSSAGTYVRAAVELSRLARAPVRLVLDREEEQLDTGNRPATIQRLRIGAKRDGKLTAIALEEHGTAGVGLGAGVGNIAQAMYPCPHFSIAQHDVFINAGPGTAMRAPGNVPGAFALEQLVDELAEKLGMDALLLRDRIDPNPVRREERRIGAARIGWPQRHRPAADAGVVKRGIGVAQSYWGANVQLNSACEVRILRDGSVEVCSSVQDIGTGICTVLAQVVAEELGLRTEQITVRIGDTDFPSGPPSYGSMTTASITPPARNAARRALGELCAAVAPSLGVLPNQLIAREGCIAAADGSRTLSFAEAAARLRTDRISVTASRSDDYGGFARRGGDMANAQQHLGGVQFAAVAVDTETGVVRVERVVAVHDCGRPINPLQIESQVHGGVLMGISYALYEQRVLDRGSGRVLNANLEDYKIGRSLELPQIEVIVLENYQGMSATDAYGVAEPATIPTAPAVANAVYNALGVRVRELPMTPARVLAAIAALRTGSAS